MVISQSIIQVSNMQLTVFQTLKDAKLGRMTIMVIRKMMVTQICGRIGGEQVREEGRMKNS
jgi:hypothetical protein